MSQDQELRLYQDWSTVQAVSVDLTKARFLGADVVIDLTDGHAPSMEIEHEDGSVEVMTVESDTTQALEASDDASYVAVRRDEWERMTSAARALVAMRAAANIDADDVPLGRHVDLRG